jgi:hypothetical protein
MRGSAVVAFDEVDVGGIDRRITHYYADFVAVQGGKEALDEFEHFGRIACDGEREAEGHGDE